ncbi:retrovirus-related pol polyprotein from transposon TNT 1-94 [Tanacetum coccineum]
MLEKDLDDSWKSRMELYMQNKEHGRMILELVEHGPLIWPSDQNKEIFPVFSPGDDLIACLNKAMAFLTAVASSRFPSTNNQLRTSSNLRNQATIQDGRVTVQQVSGETRAKLFWNSSSQAQDIIPHNDLSNWLSRYLRCQNVMISHCTSGILLETTFPTTVRHISQGVALYSFKIRGPNSITPSPKKVAVTPMNNVKKVRFAEPLISSSNIKQVESSNTSDSNTLVLSSTGVNCSTNCRSKPLGNKKNDSISQTPSRNKKNKVEAQPRKVNKTNRVVKPICNVDVKHSLSNVNSKILCATCNKSMLSRLYSGTVRFGNDRIARIWGMVTINWETVLSQRFLKTKDEALAAIIKCIKNIQVRLKATVQNVRTDNGTEFVNQKLREWYENFGITHQTFVVHSSAERCCRKVKSDSC